MFYDDLYNVVNSSKLSMYDELMTIYVVVTRVFFVVKVIYPHNNIHTLNGYLLQYIFLLSSFLSLVREILRIYIVLTIHSCTF